MDHSPSPLDTLRQLKDMLDAGALTPAEFEMLKQRLVFDDDALFAPAAPEPVAPAAGPFPPVPVPPGAEPPLLADDQSAAAVFAAFPPATDRPTAPEGSAAPVSFAAPAPAAVPPPDPEPNWVADEFPDSGAPAARNPLMLVLSIGGLLALLGLVVYLSLNRPPSERISSTSLTAADTLAAPIETGPQAEPLPPVVAAAPETVRVAPTNPAPPVQPRPAPVVRDSAAAAPPAAPADSAAGQ
ncbi:SHOCT domain-containing protein [Hymenobacter sp.]|uniref:SHOCT domain-containing protein n=1 Tax=Hymenobacter sp. TaxID=1898978 RepID=UPI00286CBB22|nr:SHOCT domain-containing protein [Hymenobacter sp.]